MDIEKIEQLINEAEDQPKTELYRSKYNYNIDYKLYDPQKAQYTIERQKTVGQSIYDFIRNN